MKTAITGGIGSGKSFFCDLLRSRGIAVYDCDSAAKRIMREDAGVVNQIKKAVGEDAYTNDGLLNKARMASFILSSEQNARLINSIVHPAVAADFKRSGIDVMECAILFQSGFDKLVDRIICISANKEVRVRRIMSRDSISREKALEWIACQMPQEEMDKRSDVVVEHNADATEDDLNKLISEISRS